MQSDYITILHEADGFTIKVDDTYYSYSHYNDSDDILQLCLAIQHITSNSIQINVEESY